MFRRGAVVLAAAMLAGCAGLPSSGPTGVEIRKAASGKAGDFPFVLVEVQGAGDVPPGIRASLSYA